MLVPDLITLADFFIDTETDRVRRDSSALTFPQCSLWHAQEWSVSMARQACGLASYPLVPGFNS